MAKAKLQIIKAKPYSMKQEDGSINEGVSIVAFVDCAPFPQFQTKVDTPTTDVVTGAVYEGDMFFMVNKNGYPQPAFGPLTAFGGKGA